VCSAKVRLALAEKGQRKGADWDGPLLNLDRGDQFEPGYRRLNPNAVVPTLTDGERVIIESTVINEYLEDILPEPALRPADPYGRARMRVWTKQEDAIHDAANTLTVAIAFRINELKRSDAEREARIEARPDPEKRAKWRELLASGTDSPLVDGALRRFVRLFSAMEEALGRGPWLIGAQYSLADIGMTPFVDRLAKLQLSALWEARFPRVGDWLARVTARPSYAEAIAAYTSDDRMRFLKESAEAARPRLEPRIAALLDEVPAPAA
jgi:glutathione S-transferase